MAAGTRPGAHEPTSLLSCPSPPPSLSLPPSLPTYLPTYAFLLAHPLAPLSRFYFLVQVLCTCSHAALIRSLLDQPRLCSSPPTKTATQSGRPRCSSAARGAQA